DLQKPIAVDGGHDNLHHSRSRLLTLPSTWATPTPEDAGGNDLFCADQRHLADGRVIAVGGTEWVTEQGAAVDDGNGGSFGPIELLGSKNTRIFDPATNQWATSTAWDMNYRRWYPTLVTLPSGKLFVAGGVEKLIYNDAGTNVHNTETLDPNALSTGWVDNGESGATSLPLFARLHLLPNGKVFYDATGQMWGPAGQGYDEVLWNMMKWYDPSTNSWTDKGLAEFGARSGAFSVMLPLKPDNAGNYSKAKILIAGGTIGTSPSTYIANSISEIVSIDGDSVTRKRTGDLNNRRWYSSGVVLPSGEVLALSGADKDEVIDPGSEFPVRQAEMYNPTTKHWSRLASGSRDRTYHNSAVLLADGSVLVGGHSPIVSQYGNTHANYFGPPFANNFKDPSFEILKPPYLFRGPRPTITAAPSNIGLGDDFEITTPDAGSITSVVLSRLPAVTHITDADQRTVELKIISQGSGTVKVKAPASAAVLPNGPYYLFLIRNNPAGIDHPAGPTPSIAAVVNATGTSPSAGSGSGPSGLDLDSLTGSATPPTSPKQAASKVTNIFAADSSTGTPPGSHRPRPGALLLATVAIATAFGAGDMRFRRRRTAKI
ncbi:MAG TPA: galactose oxidase-like domain-containing protein, partial [Actinomycetota bacterium]|nr:galactose oxidase-like domain-containing protein [Actinomycetota bacterium]